MSVIEVIGFGAMNVDYLYQVRQVVTEGEDIIENLTVSPGGSAANSIYALAKLGVKTGFTGIVGDDELGKMLLQDFEAVKVDTSSVYVEAGTKTGSVLCLSDQVGRRALYVSPGANDQLKQNQVNLDYLNQSKLIHLSSFVGEEQFKLQVNTVREKSTSVKVSLAPGMLYASKGLDALTPLLERTHILFLNRQEIEILTGKGHKAGVEECLKRGCQIVVVTFGKGLPLGPDKTITSYIFDGRQEYQIECKAESLKSPLETTGAGDAFAAGFLFGFLRGKELRECGVIGDLVARFTISQPGARPGLPHLKQLSEKYFQWQKQKL